jgi:excisionase family DNA binding protein
VSSPDATGRRAGVGALRRGRPAESPLLGLTELAGILGVHRSTLYRSIESGRFPLPIVRVGARISVPRAAVDRLIAGGGDLPVATPPALHDDHCPTCGNRLSARTRPTCSAARRSSSLIASV